MATQCRILCPIIQVLLSMARRKAAKYRVGLQPAILKRLEAVMRFGFFLALAIVLMFAWVGAFLVFHIAGALIHLLLLIALISLVIHLFKGGPRAV